MYLRNTLHTYTHTHIQYTIKKKKKTQIQVPKIKFEKKICLIFIFSSFLYVFYLTGSVIYTYIYVHNVYNMDVVYFIFKFLVHLYYIGMWLMICASNCFVEKNYFFLFRFVFIHCDTQTT